MAGANLTNVNATHFTPFFYLDVKDNLADSYTINLYNSKSALKNTILVTGYTNLGSTNYPNLVYTPGSGSTTLTLYRLVEIQAKDGDGKLKCYPRWVEEQDVSVEEGKVTVIDNLIAGFYKLVGSSNNLVINVSYFDEPRYVTEPYIKGTYGVPNSVVPPSMYVNPTPETIVQPSNS
jgi:hypothetical protein